MRRELGMSKMDGDRLSRLRAFRLSEVPKIWELDPGTEFRPLPCVKPDCTSLMQEGIRGESRI